MRATLARTRPLGTSSQVVTRRGEARWRSTWSALRCDHGSARENLHDDVVWLLPCRVATPAQEGRVVRGDLRREPRDPPLAAPDNGPRHGPADLHRWQSGRWL